MTRDVVIGPCRLIQGDFRSVLGVIPQADAAIVDPPYGETSLAWDRRLCWQDALLPILHDQGSLWCFGSLRFFMESAAEFSKWRMSHDVIWEKHNGTNAFNDRFRRVHEQLAHFYKPTTPWKDVVKNPIFTHDATARTVRRKKRPPHWGDIGEANYVSSDGGPRLMRSVIYCRSCHGYAIHPTQKPVDIVLSLIRYSTHAGGLVLDPFMGSATTAAACIASGRRFIGIEKSPKYFTAACERISELWKAFSLELTA